MERVKKRKMYRIGERKNKPDKKPKVSVTKQKKANIVVRVKKPKPEPTYSFSREYDFLRYIRLVFKWATDNHDISRPHLELLLYLYPMGTFTKRQFFAYHKTIGMYEHKTFDIFLDKGLIVVWRPAKKGQVALYSLTTVSKTLCNRMHKMCVGEMNVPESERFNKVAANKDKRINNYYMQMIKKMNKERTLREKGES